jgi:hypothetical protein
MRSATHPYAFFVISPAAAVINKLNKEPKTIMLQKAVFILCLGLAFVSGRAQNSIADTSGTAVIYKAGDVYNQFIEKQSRLYNGIEHLGYLYTIKGYAYWLEKMKKGSIVYDELEYINVPMLYDLVKDQVIIMHFNHVTLMGLVSEKVKEFTLGDHHFIRLDSIAHPSLITGFYDEVYKGRLAVLVRRRKFIEEQIKDELEREFVKDDYYFIKKDDTYYPIRSYKNLLTILDNKTTGIKQYLRKNRIKYKKDPETAIAKATAYYDSLNK